jgi:hypothetical protein
MLPFAVPSLSYGFLMIRSDKWKSRTWLIVCLVALGGGVIILLYVGIIKMTADLPFAIREEYVQISGSSQIVKYTDNFLKVKVDEIEFKIPHNYFRTKPFDDSMEYTIIYLPNSKYVIDVIDENGNSILK